jgi:hypothetical protein
MALTEEQKQKIEEEEAYRAKVREEHKKRGCNGCLVVVVVIVGLLIMTLIAINPAEQFERAERQQNQAILSAITPFPVNDIINKTEEEIKTTYATLYINYSDAHLTPSGKVKITGFDIVNANVQIDYEVATSKPVYVGYSFAANPLPEEAAWHITGRSKPVAEPASNPGIMNRTVYVWENIAEIEPYKMVQVIYESDGKVGKIAFSMEDLATAKSVKSLYYVP